MLRDVPSCEPLTILHVSQPVDGGVAQVVADLVRGQVADGHDVVVTCPCPEGGRLGREAVAAGARLVPWSAERGPGPGLPQEIAALRKVVGEARPDLVHLHSSKAGLAGRLAIRGRIATVFQPHAWSFEAVSGPTARMTERWERWATRWSDRLVCVSAEERARGQAVGLGGRWALVPNGIDLERYDPKGLPSRQRARRALGLTQHAPLAVCVGRLCRQKGQDLLLRAWGEVLAELPHARLALVGDGPDRGALEDCAATLPVPESVVFAGRVDDPRPWYMAGDVMVLPSRWEGMALAPLEAMACGRPVVLSDVAGARECLGEQQFPVPVGDTRTLATSLTRLLSDQSLCAELGRRSRVRTAERHDLRATRMLMAQTYDAVLQSRRVPAPAGPVGTAATAVGRRIGKSD
ncbi:glycosyltransferase involved in cell wall biosynthesis [Streptacidiphilus sp. BW17]